MASKQSGDATERTQFPKTLEGFGYHYNKNGRLRNIKTGEGFKFDVKPGDEAYNQMHYEALGKVVDEKIFELLMERGGLDMVSIPLDEHIALGEPRGFVFVSPDFHTNPDKLMILIHGAGVVRAGQWARRLLINDGLNSGSQLPYIERARKEGYSVIVLNTNQNSGPDQNGRINKIKHSESPEKHAAYVWRSLISKSPAAKIAIVAHSYGGIVTVHLNNAFPEDFKQRVFAIALTDSVHSHAMLKVPNHFTHIGRNWVQSDSPLDSSDSVKQIKGDVKRISAGTTKHEETSWKAFNSVFSYFQAMNKSHTGSSDEIKRRRTDDEL